MASRICVVPVDWNLEEYERHSCGDGSHYHIGHSELIEQKQRNLVVCLREGSRRARENDRPDPKIPERDVAWAGRITPSSAIPGEPMNAGLSFRVGEYLAKRIRQAARLGRGDARGDAAARTTAETPVLLPAGDISPFRYIESGPCRLTWPQFSREAPAPSDRNVKRYLKCPVS